MEFRQSHRRIGKSCWLSGPALAVILAVVLSLTGCVTGSSTAKIQADLDTTGMVHYQKNGVDMYLSPSWKEAELPPGQQPELKVRFADKLGQIDVMCFSPWVANQDLQEVMLSTLSPKAKVYKQPTCIENAAGTFKPCYGAFSDMVVREGEEESVSLYLAWKGSMSGCKYGIVASGIIIENDFLRTLGSLK